MPVDVLHNRLPPASEPESIRLGRKTILLTLLMVASALGLLFLFRALRSSSPFYSHVLSATCMGLTAGLSTRWIMQKQTSALRFISSMAFIIGGLELLGWFTGWQIGFGPLKVGLSSVDWYSLGQLLLGTGTAILAMAAWSAPAGRLPKSVPGHRTPRVTAQPRSRVGRRVGTAQRSRRDPVPAAVKTKPVKSQVDRKPRRKARLHLSSQIEQRCPYCLDLIIPGDPRGVVECKICHTQHHADCWAITGSCQIPHYTV